MTNWFSKRLQEHREDRHELAAGMNALIEEKINTIISELKTNGAWYGPSFPQPLAENIIIEKMGVTHPHGTKTYLNGVYQKWLNIEKQQTEDRKVKG